MLEQIDQLFEEQIASWPLLACATDNLKHAQTRMVDINGFAVQIRHLPHRIASTTARVDRESVAKRACFLCAENLPPEEKGLPFNSNFTIYCNPFPILERHMTIVHREHRPQRIVGHIADMVALANALPGYFVIYNGPECGASAPDHMHFQACSARGVPILEDVEKSRGGTIPDYARHVVVIRERDAERMIVRLADIIPPGDPEPMLNLALFKKGHDIVAALFPRKKHRPAVFYSGEFTVSPAAIDLCGILVTPVERDFQRISSQDIRRIYEEVTE
jgi:hypothetical protein